MSPRLSLLALCAGTLLLTACSKPVVLTTTPASELNMPAVEGHFDLRSSDGGQLTLTLAKASDARTLQASDRHVQLAGEVGYYLVRLEKYDVTPAVIVGPYKGFKVELGANAGGAADVTFFNLPKGTYNVYVMAVDRHGVILNKSGFADRLQTNLVIRPHGLGGPPTPLSCVVTLRDDHLDLPSSLLESSLTSVSNMMAHAGIPRQTPLELKRSPERIAIVPDGDFPSLVKDNSLSFDDETSFTLDDAAIQALKLPATPPHLLFITDEDGSNAEFLGAAKGYLTERDVAHVDPSLDPNAPMRVLRLDVPGVGTRNLYFSDAPQNALKAVSTFYDNAGFTNIPPSYMRVDPERVSSDEFFFSARYPQGVLADRTMLIDDEDNNWNIWTRQENGITQIIGMAVPFVQNGTVKIIHLQLLPDTPLAP